MIESSSNAKSNPVYAQSKHFCSQTFLESIRAFLAYIQISVQQFSSEMRFKPAENVIYGYHGTRNASCAEFWSRSQEMLTYKDLIERGTSLLRGMGPGFWKPK